MTNLFPMTNALIGAPAAAKRLGCGHSTITLWARQGRIAFVGKLGGRYIFDAAEIDALAREKAADDAL